VLSRLLRNGALLERKGRGWKDEEVEGVRGVLPRGDHGCTLRAYGSDVGIAEVERDPLYILSPLLVQRSLGLMGDSIRASVPYLYSISHSISSSIHV
jgi:hypothetical protein